MQDTHRASATGLNLRVEDPPRPELAVDYLEHPNLVCRSSGVGGVRVEEVGAVVESWIQTELAYMQSVDAEFYPVYCLRMRVCCPDVLCKDRSGHFGSSTKRESNLPSSCSASCCSVLSAFTVRCCSLCARFSCHSLNSSGSTPDATQLSPDCAVGAGLGCGVAAELSDAAGDAFPANISSLGSRLGVMDWRSWLIVVRCAFHAANSFGSTPVVGGSSALPWLCPGAVDFKASEPSKSVRRPRLRYRRRQSTYVVLA